MYKEISTYKVIEVDLKRFGHKKRHFSVLFKKLYFRSSSFVLNDYKTRQQNDAIQDHNAGAAFTAHTFQY